MEPRPDGREEEAHRTERDPHELKSEARGWRRYPHRPGREAITAEPHSDGREGRAYRVECDPHEPESATVRRNLEPRDAKPEA